MITSPYNTPRILPPHEHPRLMFRKKDLERISENIRSEECGKEAELWRRLCGMSLSAFSDTINKGVYNSLVCMMLESKMLKAYLEGSADEARKLIDTVLSLCINYDPESDWLMKARFGGHIVFVCSLCYDWLYPYWTPEQRSQMIDACERILSTTLEMGYPPSKQSTIGSHAAEAQLLRDTLSFSVAVYDERPDIYKFCAGRIFDEYVPCYKALFSGRFPLQGPAYGGYRYCFAAWCQLIFAAMSGERVFDENLERTCESLYMMLRPDGEYMRLGNYFYESKGADAYTRIHPAVVPMFFAGALTGNELYRKYYSEHYDERFLLPDKHGRDYYKDGAFGEGLLSPVAFLIFNRFTPVCFYSEMPKAVYFGGPAGITIYRNGETLILMKIGQRCTTAHDHYDCGHFEIYHKGILASDSGLYDWFGCEHHYNYLARTYAHNCVTVTDPEKIGSTVKIWNKDAVYDGGQVIIRNGYDVPDLDAMETEYKRGIVLDHTESDTLVELSGDLTAAYSEQCCRYVRTMSFEPKKSVFTVRDEIAAKNEGFIKQFHVHTQTPPKKLDDRTFVIENGGRLVCTVVEPKNCTVEFIGGKDNEFSLYGINHPRNARALHGGDIASFNDEGGWGRVTVTARDIQKEDIFLVRFEISDGE